MNTSPINHPQNFAELKNNSNANFCRPSKIVITERHLINIRNLDVESKITILEELIDNLGVVSVEDYCFANCVKQRTIYEKLKAGSIKFIQISNKRFPLINY